MKIGKFDNSVSLQTINEIKWKYESDVARESTDIIHFRRACIVRVGRF